MIKQEDTVGRISILEKKICLKLRKRSIPSLSLNAHKFAVVLHLLKCYF